MNEHAPYSTHPDAIDQRQEHAAGQNSIPELVKRLADDLSTLLGKEIALARAELRQAADQARAGVGSLVPGYGLVLCGALFVLLAAVFGLALVVPAWAASLIVGVAALIVGLIMVSAGKKKIEPQAFVPERTVDSVRKDKDMTKRLAS